MTSIKNLKIKCIGATVVRFEIVTLNTELKFTAAFSNSKKAKFIFNNSSEDVKTFKGASSFYVFDMETIEIDKKFKTTFTTRYDCSSSTTMHLEIVTGDLYDAEAIVKSCDQEIQYVEDGGQYFAKFKNHEHLTSYYKKDFIIINPPKPR